MRNAFLPMLLLAFASTSCERPSSDAPAAPATAPAVTRPSSPTTASIRLKELTTEPATTRAAATSPNDPLATPASALAHLFDLMEEEDVAGVRAMMADPKPAEQIVGDIEAVARRLQRGAKWAIVDSHVAGLASIVIFRTTFADGKQDVSPLFFVNRYDRWKVMLGQTNFKRFTEGEKDDLKKVIDWGVKRMKELGPTTTKSTPKTDAAPATAESTPKIESLPKINAAPKSP